MENKGHSRVEEASANIKGNLFLPADKQNHLTDFITTPPPRVTAAHLDASPLLGPDGSGDTREHRREEDMDSRDHQIGKKLSDFLADFKNQEVHYNRKCKNTIRSFRQSSDGLNKAIDTIEKEAQNVHSDCFYSFMAHALVEEITKRALTIDDLPQCLSELRMFKSFNECQMMIHHKGTTNVISYSHHTLKKIKVVPYPVVKFHRLFEGIRKKKKKIFDGSNFQKAPLNIIGKFLANTIELQSHNVLIIISKGSFLPPSDLEVDLFYQMTKALKPFVKQLLRKENKEDKVYYNFICLKLIPVGLEVRNQQNQIIFSNDYRLLHPCETDCKTVQIDDSHKIYIYFGENKDLITDFSHYERIQLLGGLLNTLSHELSNPIFGMKLACDLLKSEIQNNDSQELLTDISKTLKRSQTILKGFSTLYQDSTQIVSLQDIINDTLIIAKSEIKEITKKVQYHSDKKTIKIETNPTWLSQILFNLVLNSSQALKSYYHSPKDQSMTIDIYKTQHHYEINICDNGPGVPPHLTDKIFRPFFTTKTQGTGLGLAICQNLTRKLGGQLVLKTTKHSGASFSLILPQST